MTTEKRKISLTRALSEKKTLKKRIEKAVREISFAGGILKTGTIPTGFVSIEEYSNKLKGDYQSLKDLVSNLNNLSKAIIDANNKTVVKIGQEELTIAELMDRRDFHKNRSNLTVDGIILDNIKRQFEQLEYTKKTMEEQFERGLQQHLETNKADKNDAKKVQEHTDYYTKNNKVEHIDPLKVLDILDEYKKKVDEFNSEVDFVLSEANAKTDIVVEF